VDFEGSRSINKVAKLVPVKNGILNLTTKKLLKWDPNYYFTHALNVSYNPKAKISRSMINFLLDISNKILIPLRY
jgi:phage/plasmid-associated DNA primase